MKLKHCAWIAVALSSAGLQASVAVQSFAASMRSPQHVGTPVSFNVTASDTSPGPLTFQFSVSYSGGKFDVIRNFNIGSKAAGVWTAQPFSWASIAGEGSYSIQVVVKDVKTGETATDTIPFELTSLVPLGGRIRVTDTQNPLVGLATVPACAAGKSVRAYFSSRLNPTLTYTTFQPCGGTVSSNIYLGGLRETESYTVGYQILTGSTVTDGGSTSRFRTGRLPGSISFPTQTVVVPPLNQADAAEPLLLHSYINLGAGTGNYQPTATDLAGNVNWFYDGQSDLQVLLTRPLAGGHFLVFQSGLSWDTGVSTSAQLLRQIDLAGNVERETNIGLLQQQLLAIGATDLQACKNIPSPAPIGAACLTALSHDAILLPNGNYAFIANVEKIFPPGTQGDKTGLNVDIIGDAIIVIDAALNAVWYNDTFQHAGGGNQLDINRPAVLGETCAQGQGGCPPLFLAGRPGVTTLANDWLHSNSLQYRASDGHFILSVRHQDWVLKVDYANGAGSGNILWRMGPSGDFAIDNVYGDAYPWFSHQHDAGFESSGAFTVFDNGNTRVSQLGGNSRGMSLNVDELGLSVTPVLSQDLGHFAFALGSAQLLGNGNYHFQLGIVAPANFDQSIELFPAPLAPGATQVFNLESGVASYRSFRMQDMYRPPTT